MVRQINDHHKTLCQKKLSSRHHWNVNVHNGSLELWVNFPICFLMIFTSSIVGFYLFLLLLMTIIMFYEKRTYRFDWLKISFSFSWSMLDGNFSSFGGPNDGRLKKSGTVLRDVSGSLLIGDADCWRWTKCGYCCRNCELKFMNAEMDGVEFSKFCTLPKENVFYVLNKII